MKTFFISSLLAFRRVQRSSWWTRILIVSVMTFTFINLVAVKAILVGIVEGSRDEQRNHYTGDVIIKPDPLYLYIRDSQRIIEKLNALPEVQSFSPRYLGRGTLQADFKENKKQSEELDEVGAQLVGIDPQKENEVTEISSFITQGRFLTDTDFDEVVLGADLLEEYAVGADATEDSLSNITIGSRIRLLVGENKVEVTVVGIINTKSGTVSSRAYFHEDFLRQLIGRNDLNRGEISIKLHSNVSPEAFASSLKRGTSGRLNQIETWVEAQGAFLTDISNTFGSLGDIIGSIGLFIASGTIFIIIFINALNAQKYIGIMKAIGVTSTTITLSYIMQSVFYGLFGIILGSLFILGFLEPYFIANPLDFPFSDGILAISYVEMFVRGSILTGATVIAGLIPARIIVNKNTIDSILQR